MTTEKSTEEKIVLKGEVALALWRQGKDTWNQWVEDNPVADVDFSFVDFGEERTEENPVIDFRAFRFPEGRVSFHLAKFGEGNVSFDKAQFGDGDFSFIDTRFGEGNVSFNKAVFGGGNVHFNKAKFGKGYVNFGGAEFGEGSVYFGDAEFGEGYVAFDEAQFGEGHVSFSGTKFGEGKVSFGEVKFGEGGIWFIGTRFGKGYVSFGKAQFGEGKVSFNEVQFGEGGVSFFDAKFGEGDVSFINAVIGEGDVSFYKTQFGEGNVHFNKAQFGDGHVSFYKAQFGEGNVHFNEAQFGEGYICFIETQFSDCNVSFGKAQFGEGDYSFEKATFGGQVNFSSISDIDEVISLSLKGCCFEKTLDLSGNHFPFIPDLTATKTNNHVSLHGFSCDLSKDSFKKGFFTFDKARNTDDVARLGRLKEIAENNKDHERALAFYADEMRAKRWQENTTIRSNLLDLTYDKLSNYGRSESRPVTCLIGLWLLFAGCYYAMSGNTMIAVSQKICAALAFSASQIIPIAPGSKPAQLQSAQLLFFGKMELGLYLVTLAQSVLSIALLFLIGLALRNRFRI